MKSGFFSRLTDKYKGLKSSERWLINIAAVLILIFATDRVLFFPIRYNTEVIERNIAEKERQLSDIRKYLMHRELQKELFKGKPSDFLNIFLQQVNSSRLGPVKLKKTESSEKGILIDFEGSGNIDKILELIIKLEQLDFLVLFQRADISFIKLKEYHFDAEILVVKDSK